jgi:SAM-dependent methyltransferase
MTADIAISRQADSLPHAGMYLHLRPAERYIHATRDAALFRALARAGVTSLGSQRILEVGCSTGSLLKSLLQYGADPGLATGIDLSPQAARAAQKAVASDVAVADGAILPFSDGKFDLVFLFTALSSMLDMEVRRHAAREALRVLAPAGHVVVYDFQSNPFNTRVRPVRIAELRHLFEGATIVLDRVTLAPPLVRILGGRTRACEALERLNWLRSHILAVVTKEQAHA